MAKRESLVLRVTRQLAEIRSQRDVTQEQLAELLGLPVQNISRIEAGQNITLETLERFAVALGLRVAVVFEPSGEARRKAPPSRRQRARKS